MTIAVHLTNTTYHQPHFFIQRMGYNAGRPSAQPYSNSYVLFVNDELEKGISFWVCLALWKANRFLPLIDNRSYSLDEQRASELINDTCEKLSTHPQHFRGQVKELKELIQTEQRLAAQIKLIKLLKNSIARRIVR